MLLIKNKEQLVQNINTIEYYLTEGADEEQDFAYNLLRLGSCFVAYQIGKELRFAPSRFLGYVNNNFAKHSTAKRKGQLDGKETNPAITKILGKLGQNKKLDEEYNGYCKSIGLNPSQKNNRKFWECELNVYFTDNAQLSGEFPEGKIVERIHKARERNSQVIQIAKDNFKKKNNGKVFCENCLFDFEQKYGSIGNNFIEAHHKIAISDMPYNHKTKPEDIALLCANCHRMVHIKRPWLSMAELKKLTGNNVSNKKK